MGTKKANDKNIGFYSKRKLIKNGTVYLSNITSDKRMEETAKEKDEQNYKNKV